METRIIKAVFGASKSIIAPKRFKNDWGQVLELVGITLPQTFTAHFANSKTGTAKKRIGQNNQVDVPDEFFTSGADIYCWVMVHDTVSDGRTMYTVRIPIEDRGTATDEEPTPVQQDVIEQAIAALNAAVEQTGQDVESADASAQSASDSADRAETARDTAEGYVSTVQGYAQQAQASANNASASATASAQSASTAQQIKTDVEGMVDEAQSAAGASAQSALESEQSASQASTFATFASQSAETASTKASEASTSAQTASTKATEASGYASTASAKASESSQSASAASGYATAAGQAKTAAETAQGLAEQAQSDAESAKADAESARDAAQGYAESINPDEIDAKIYAVYATDTATSAVASFPDGADNIPMVDVKVAIEPVQDLHGYDSPWVGGGGKNLLNPNIIEIGSYDPSGLETQGGNNTYRRFKLTLPEGNYVFSTDLEDCYFIRALINNVVVWASRTTQSYSFTLSETSELKIAFRNTASTAITQSFNCMIESGSTATDYAPYSNICPISGWSGVNVSHSGADISDATVYSITFPVEAGTVYGGTLDVTTGVLTVDRANIASYNGETLPSTWISDRDAYSVGTTPTTGAQVVYKLATPITYQLTPTEIRSLHGQNNIFADTGDSTVEYRADTKLYISKKIAEAVNALA